MNPEMEYAVANPRQGSTLGRATLEVAQDAPLYSRIESLLDEAISVLSETINTQAGHLGRTFGFPPTEAANGADKAAPESAAFEHRAMSRLHRVLADARTARSLSNEIANRC